MAGAQTRMFENGFSEFRDDTFVTGAVSSLHMFVACIPYGVLDMFRYELPPSSRLGCPECFLSAVPGSTSSSTHILALEPMISVCSTHKRPSFVSLVRWQSLRVASNASSLKESFPLEMREAVQCLQLWYCKRRLKHRLPIPVFLDSKQQRKPQIKQVDVAFSYESTTHRCVPGPANAVTWCCSRRLRVDAFISHRSSVGTCVPAARLSLGRWNSASPAVRSPNSLSPPRN